MSQVAAIAARFPQIRKALLFGKNDALVPITRMEYVCPEYEEYNIVLRFPRLCGFSLKLPVRKRVACFFCTNYPHQTYAAWLDFIPERCERWGKFQIANGGDCIRSAVACNPSSVYGKCDASFVGYVFQKDENEDDPSANIKMVDAIGYGHLNFILLINLAKDKADDDDNDDEDNFLHDTPPVHILAHVTEAKGVEGDGSKEILTFTQFGWSFILNITSITHIAGRVFTRGVRPAGEWAIIDRTQGLEKTNFQVEEHGSSDEEGWDN
ncbi:hypothetical protein RSAG8_05749, partial [Rhizoctonia solani AG-8 WAC10335]